MASGRFVVRLPRSLHADLVAEAEREGVSLNQFVVGALAGAIGWRAEGGTPGSEEGTREAKSTRP